MESQCDLPFLPTPKDTIFEIFEFLNSKKHLNKMTLVDLGAGDGRVLFHAAENYQMRSTGVEINLNFIESVKEEIKQRNLSQFVTVVEADLFNFDISNFDIIFCYLTPACDRFLPHLIKNIKAGAFVVSIRWPLKDLDEYWGEIYELRYLTEPAVWIYEKTANP